MAKAESLQKAYASTKKLLFRPYSSSVKIKDFDSFSSGEAKVEAWPPPYGYVFAAQIFATAPVEAWPPPYGCNFAVGKFATAPVGVYPHPTGINPVKKMVDKYVLQV